MLVLDFLILFGTTFIVFSFQFLHKQRKKKVIQAKVTVQRQFEGALVEVWTESS